MSFISPVSNSPRSIGVYPSEYSPTEPLAPIIEKPEATSIAVPSKVEPLERSIPQLSLIKSKELEKFKEQLSCFFTFDKNPDQIATDLFKIVPKDLKLKEIVSLVFEKARRKSVLLILDAILIAHPSFTLSPYDKIRKAIFEDKDHLLNNTSLMAMLKKEGLDKNKDKITAIYKLAYRLDHPYIYPLSPIPVPTDDYTLNFLWVNLDPQDRIQDKAQNIFKDGLELSENAECLKDPKALRTLETTEQSLEKDNLENWEKIKKSFTYRLSKWADVHPGAQINLWYDSALVTQKARQKTFEMMRDISTSRKVNLTLRDIRQLPKIKDEIKNSLHPGTQVFYRVDILKALIADYMIRSKESANYCIVTDGDVEPMSSQQIFDKRTMHYLSSKGYVFNKVGIDNFENSFFIFNKAKKDLRKIHYKTIIEKTVWNIASVREYALGTSLKSEYVLDAQCVFRKYLNFRVQMKEKSDDDLTVPRKVVKCPKSQFNFGGTFSASDYQAESFRFIGKSTVPYTYKGRGSPYTEAPIDALKTWKAEPLTD